MRKIRAALAAVAFPVVYVAARVIDVDGAYVPAEEYLRARR